jgi:hypothetical protein
VKFGEFNKPMVEITFILKINGPDPMWAWEENSK